MTFSVPEDRRPASRASRAIGALRRLLHRRLHADRARRRAAHGEGRRRRRLVLRGDGSAPGARPTARPRTTMARTRAGAAVLTYRFWTTSLNSDPDVVGKTIRLGPRTATVVGVLEPSVPYPADTEIIANVVTSPHHLGATMVTEPHASHDRAVRPARAGRDARGGARRADGRARRNDARASRGVLDEGQRPADGHEAARSDRGARADDPARAARGGGGRVRHRVLERRQPDPRALGPPRRRARRARRARRRPRRAAAHAARREPGALRGRRGARRRCWRGRWSRWSPATRRASRSARSRSPSMRACSGSAPALAMAAAVLLAFVPRLPSPHAPAGLGLATGSVRITPGTNRRLRAFATTQIAFSFVLLAGAGMLLATLVTMQTANTGYDMRHVLAIDVPSSATGVGGAKVIDFFRRRRGASASCPASRASRVGSVVPWRDAGSVRPRRPVRRRGLHARRRRREPARRACGSSGRVSSPCSASRCSPAASSPTTNAASRWRSSARASRSGCSRTARR